MSPAAPRLVIVEPCLVASEPGAAGSHAGRFVAALARAAGENRCTVVARRGFGGGDGIPPACAVHATLPFGPHSKVTAAGELDRLDDRGRPRFRLEPPWAAWHRHRRREERIEGFACGVLPALVDLRAGDVVLVTTASELEVAGLARAIGRARLPVGIGWHALVHMALERGFAADRARQARRLERVRRLLADAVDVAAPHRIALHATTPELAAQYARLGVAPCGVLPYPVVMPAPPPWSRGTSAAPRAVALGDARPEKNSHRLADVIDAVGRMAGVDRMAFVVQRNLGFAATSSAPEHEATRRCLAMLSGRPNVELVDGPLDDRTYVDHLHRADVALLAYDQDRYRTRLSAILLEALVAGAVPIVTGGGWMGRQLEAARSDLVARTVAAAGSRLRVGVVSRTTVGRSGLTMRCAVPAGTAALVVEMAWTRRGTDALAESPICLRRVTDDATDPPVAATVACAPTTEDTARLLVPLRPTAAPRTVTLHAGPDRAAGEVTIESLVVDALAGTVPPPAGAAGVIVADVADVPAALAEVARHADHYRRSAAALGTMIAAIHSRAALLARLVP